MLPGQRVETEYVHGKQSPMQCKFLSGAPRASVRALKGTQGGPVHAGPSGGGLISEG